jgi:hypothetical protein
VYNLNYTPITLGDKVEEKLCLGVRERKRLHTTVLDNRLTDGSEDVCLTRRSPALSPQEDSGYSFLLEAVSTPGP